MKSNGKFFKKNNKGFSLVELSIVLIIVSFIVFAVVSAKSLIINSRLLDLSSTVKKINMAQTSFINAYKQVPGDANITSFGAEYSKGNNDGFVGEGSVLDVESILFFTHLHKAGFLEEVYEKTTAPDSIEEITKDYYPETKFKNVFIGVVGSSFNNLYIRSTRFIFFSNSKTTHNFTPKIAEKYNKKFDDGSTSNGKIISINTEL